MTHLGPLYAERARLAFAMEHGHGLECDAAKTAWPFLHADLAEALGAWPMPPRATTASLRTETAADACRECGRPWEAHDPHTAACPRIPRQSSRDRRTRSIMLTYHKIGCEEPCCCTPTEPSIAQASVGLGATEYAIEAL